MSSLPRTFSLLHPPSLSILPFPAPFLYPIPKMSAQSQPKQLKKFSRDEVAKVSSNLQAGWCYVLLPVLLFNFSSSRYLITDMVYSSYPSFNLPAPKEGWPLDHHRRRGLRCLQVLRDAPWRWIRLLRGRGEYAIFVNSIAYMGWNCCRDPVAGKIRAASDIYCIPLASFLGSHRLSKMPPKHSCESAGA